MPSTPEISLSIVIPAKNEEAHITGCLDSLSEHNPVSRTTEIILVDCASTDKTVSIAYGYPVKIAQLKPDWPHSPAAARSVGTRLAHAEFIFFIDADMTLAPGFLEAALEYIKKDRVCAGVGGIGREIYSSHGQKTGEKENLYRTDQTTAQVRFLGGAGLYRRSMLSEAGGFHPYLKAGEENELAQRIRLKGYRLISLPIPMITHHTVCVDTWSEFVRKRNMGFFVGIGQSLTLSHTTRFLFESLVYYKEFSLFLIYALYADIMLTCAVLLAKIKLALLAYTPCALIFLLLILKKKSIPKAVLSMVKWLLISFDIFLGILRGVADKQKYPQEPVIIKGDSHA